MDLDRIKENIANYTGRRCPKGYLFQFRIDYSTLFSTFWHGQAKETNGKNAFKLEKLQSLKVGFVENYRRYNSSISYGGGNGTATEILTGVRGTQKSMSFLYWCDVSEMIVCTKK